MTITDAPLADLNRFAAERIEPKPTRQGQVFGSPFFGTESSLFGAWVWKPKWETDLTDSGSGRMVDNGEWQASDFSQPHGLKMLLERLVRKESSWKRIHARVFLDNEEIGRVTVEEFCLSEGWTG